MSRPTSPAHHGPSTLVVVLGALALVLPWIYLGLADNDEYGTLSNGMRTAIGQVLYRDYRFAEPPLTHWLMALPYLAFGASVVAARWLQAMLLIIASWQLYRLICWLGARPWSAVLPAWLLLGCFYAWAPGVNHHWLVLPFVLAALLAGLGAAEADDPRGWALAGGWAGLAMLALQTDGTVVAVALVANLVVGGWLVGTPARALARQVGWLALGWAVPLGLGLTAIAATGMLGAFVTQVLLWPFRHYRVAGGINDIRFLTDLYRWAPPMAETPFARPTWYLRLATFLGTALLPLAGAAGALAWGLGLVGQRLAGQLATPLARRFGFVAITAIGYWLLALSGRVDVEHLAMYASPALVLAGALAAHALAHARGQWAVAATVPTLALAALLGGGLAHGAERLTWVPRYMWSLGGPDMRAREDATLAYLRAHAQPGDRMVAVPAGGYYYYYGLPPAVRWSSVYNRASRFMGDDELDAFWRDVAASRARFLVVDPSDEPFMRDAFPGPPPGYRPVYQAPSLRYLGPWVTVYERAGP